MCEWVLLVEGSHGEEVESCFLSTKLIGRMMIASDRKCVCYVESL